MPQSIRHAYTHACTHACAHAYTRAYTQATVIKKPPTPLHPPTAKPTAMSPRRWALPAEMMAEHVDMAALNHTMTLLKRQVGLASSTYSVDMLRPACTDGRTRAM